MDLDSFFFVHLFMLNKDQEMVQKVSHHKVYGFGGLNLINLKLPYLTLSYADLPSSFSKFNFKS